MNVEQVKASYRRMLGEFETISIRRYDGTTSRTSADYDCLGKPTEFTPDQLVGTVVDGDSKVFAFVDDLIAANIELPISTSTDRVVIEGREFSIVGVDAKTIRLRGQTIAFILHIRGGIIVGSGASTVVPTYYILGF